MVANSFRPHSGLRQKSRLSEQLPDAVVELLTSCPASGQGVHHWIWRAAVALRPFLPPDEIKRMLQAASKNSGRDRSQEIEDAVTNSQRPPPDRRSGRGRIRRRTSPRIAACSGTTVNDAFRRKIVENGGDISLLTRSSPTELPTDQRQIARFCLDKLYPGDPLLCVAPVPNRHFTARKKEIIKKPHLYSLIVPSPMSSVWGINKKGKRSQRCLDNTGPRIYLICEFDLVVDPSKPNLLDQEFLAWAFSLGKTIPDISAALIMHLAKAAPLVAAIDSGGKSLHGWFNVEGWDEAEVARFMTVAIRLGADHHTLTKYQLVRMPGAVRWTPDLDLQAFQDVLYFDASRCATLTGATK